MTLRRISVSAVALFLMIGQAGCSVNVNATASNAVQSILNGAVANVVAGIVNGVIPPAGG